METHQEEEKKKKKKKKQLIVYKSSIYLLTFRIKTYLNHNPPLTTKSNNLILNMSLYSLKTFAFL